MKDWSGYQNNTYNQEPNKLLSYFDNIKIKNIVDLGCGCGNETVYMLKKGCNVVAIDAQINREYFCNRLTEKEKNKLFFVESTFEKLTVPKSDMVMAFFSIPFCNPDYFDKLWDDIYKSINNNGYFVGELFGDRHVWKDNNINTFSKEKVLDYLKNYEIIKCEEVDYIRKSDKKRWHFFEIIAQKK